jgi:hypothetical protein
MFIKLLCFILVPSVRRQWHTSGLRGKAVRQKCTGERERKIYIGHIARTMDSAENVWSFTSIAVADMFMGRCLYEYRDSFSSAGNCSFTSDVYKMFSN